MDQKYTLHKNDFDLPPTICVELLNWCNLTCRNCRSSSSPYQNNKIDIHQLNIFMNSFSQLVETFRISISGGEPLYYDDIEFFLQNINNLQIPYSLTTNGVVHKQRVEKISELLSKDSTLNVSIDGDRYYNDKQRGDGNFARSISTVKKFIDNSVKVNINTVMFFDHIYWLSNMIDLVKQLGINNWTFISPVNTGRQDEAFNRDYKTEYNAIKVELDKCAIPSYFLDFNDIEQDYYPTAHISPTGILTLPSVLHGSANINSLVASKININDPTAPIALVESFRTFAKQKSKSIV